MELTKAKFVVHWYQSDDEEIDVQINPTEFTLDKKAQIAEIAIPGLDAPLQQFIRGQAEKLTVDLLFDTTEEGMGEDADSAAEWADKIFQLTKIEPDRHAPPICDFEWNSSFPGAAISGNLGNQRRNSFKCIVESVKQKFTLFSPEGVPLRATVTTVLREYKALDEQLEQLNLNSPDRTHGHVLQQGESLWHAASRYYGRPGEWRHIAEENDIEDPRRIEAGVLLSVPKIT